MINQRIIVLTDGDSASAAEVLASVLKDYHEAVTVGTRTYGKGTVQQLFRLSDGGLLKLTTGRWFSPLGNSINKVGLAPDLPIVKSDPLTAAEILMTITPSRDAGKGLMKVKVADQEFEIDPALCSDPASKLAYQEIMMDLSLGGAQTTEPKN
jgi:carboxyl-terminal processing protease